MRKRILIGVCFLSAVMVLSASGILGAPQATSEKRVISMTNQPPTSPFSPALLVKDTLFISGQLGVNPETGKLEGPTMTEQAERIIKNIEVLCKRAGLDLSHVVETTAFITDFAEFGEFNTVFRKYFPTIPPTRATVQVVKLAMDAKIEISAVAVK
jgi:2-iminobutanoate/2-iminopropanoate deaminase